MQGTPSAGPNRRTRASRATRPTQLVPVSASRSRPPCPPSLLIGTFEIGPLGELVADTSSISPDADRERATVQLRRRAKRAPDPFVLRGFRARGMDVQDL